VGRCLVIVSEPGDERDSESETCELIDCWSGYRKDIKELL